MENLTEEQKKGYLNYAGVKEMTKEIIEQLQDRPIGNQIPVTYAELCDMRSHSKLISGATYRLTNYRCYTTQEGTRAADHIFDILITAISPNTLSEKCGAALHAGDTYFAGSNLSAWTVYYTLDNDTSTYKWADTKNGRGVIYRLIDERNNDVHYDFKNIQFLRDSEFVSTYGDVVDYLTAADGYYFTFTYIDSNNNVKDVSLPDVAWLAKKTDTEDMMPVRENTIKQGTNPGSYNLKQYQHKLTNNIFVLNEIARTGQNNSRCIEENYLSMAHENTFGGCNVYMNRFESGYSAANVFSDKGWHCRINVTGVFVHNVIEGAAFEEIIISGRVSGCTFKGSTTCNTLSGTVTDSTFKQIQNSLVSGYVQNSTFAGNVQSLIVSGSILRNTYSGNVLYLSVSGLTTDCQIGGDVANVSISGEFNKNTITGNCKHTMVNGPVSNNNVKGSFGQSVFNVNFSNNTINASFLNNNVEADFTNNVINCPLRSCHIGSAKYVTFNADTSGNVVDYRIVDGLNSKSTGTMLTVKLKAGNQIGHTLAQKSDGTVIDYVEAESVKSVETIADTTAALSLKLRPNVFYNIQNARTSITITFDKTTAVLESEGVLAEYSFRFRTGSTATTLTMPSWVQWANEPEIKANKEYEVSVVDGRALIAEFDIVNDGTTRY